MADDPKPSLHIDSDWKKQAQEEKRRLAEQDAARKKQAEATAAAPLGVVTLSRSPQRRARAGRAGPGRRQEAPPAGLDSLVQSLMTQVLFYVGDVAARGGEPIVNLDMAKHNLDTLTVLESKTKGNLTPDEQKMMDTALYESRMRFIAVANRYAELP